MSGCFDGPSNSDTVSDDLAMAPGCPRPQKHSLRLGRGRHHLPDCIDHCRHRRRTRRLYRPAAKGIWLDNRGDLLGAVDPLHPVRVDGAFCGCPAQSFRSAQRHALGAVGRAFGSAAFAGDDKSLAIDAPVGSGGRHRHRHDRTCARRHYSDTMVFGASRTRDRHSHRKHGHRSVGVSSATANLTDHFGWRIALGLMCGMLGLAALVSMVMRDHPGDVGLRPFGDTGAEPLCAPPRSSAPIVATALGALRDAAKTRIFWILFATFFICGASTTGLVQVHLIPMCVDYGIPQVQAAGLLAAMGLFDFVGTTTSGWLSDRYDNRYLLCWYYGLRGSSLLLLPFTNFSLYGLSLFAMIYGLDWIATVPPTVKLTAQKFGSKRANLVFGWIYAGHQLGAASAAFSAGLSRTELASYLPAFFAAGLLCIIAALMTLAIARQSKQVAI